MNLGIKTEDKILSLSRIYGNTKNSCIKTAEPINSNI